MITIESRRALKSQEARYVLVRTEDIVYLRVGHEYIPKRYFSVIEASEILGVQRYCVHRFCGTLGIQAHANKRKKLKITLDQLRRMAAMK